jgi:uncharacterized repeat protein (TIGR01451 family)
MFVRIDTILEGTVGNVRKLSLDRLGVLVVILLLSPGLTLLSADEAPTSPGSIQAPAQSGWELLPDPPAFATMATLDMLDATAGMSGGMAGFVFRYDGTDWRSLATAFDSYINGIDMVTDSLGWGVTWQGEMILWNGVSWQVHSKPATSSLDDVFMLGATDGWAVGGVSAAGVSSIFRYDVGSGTWVQYPAPTSSWLKAVDMVNANEGWAVGVQGTFLRWNGAAWNGLSLYPGLVLFDVDMVSASDGWAVGSGGRLFHYSGSAWSEVPSPTSYGLHAVHMLDGNEGWAVGEMGTILHYSGGAWQLVPSPTTTTLNAIQMVSPAEGWAMGQSGTILHYSGVFDLSASTKTVSPRWAQAGETLTYTVTVRNTGTALAPSVFMTDTIPADTTYVPGSAWTSQGTIQGPDPLVVSVGDVAPGGEATITFQVTVDNLGLDCWFVPNEALVGSGETQLVRGATTTVGNCHSIYLPLISNGN